MRFVGHLDMMRYFQKAMRRAKIDIAYTEGFSPHQVMSFAAPLGVGITSDSEYFDIEVHSSKSTAESIRALNEAMAEGVRVTGYRLLPEGTPNAMASVAAADYLLRAKAGWDDMFAPQPLGEALDAFYSGQEQILVTKQTKKGEREMDLKPLIYEIRAVDEEPPAIFLKICAGSTDNVRPELVLEAFLSHYREKQSWKKQMQEEQLQDMQSRDVQSQDGRSQDTQSLDEQSRDEQSWDVQSRDVQSRDVRPLDAQSQMGNGRQGKMALEDFSLHRLEVYARDGDGFVPLGELGEDIL